MNNTEKARILQQAAEILEELAQECHDAINTGKVTGPDACNGHYGWRRADRLTAAGDLLTVESEGLAQGQLAL